MLASSSDIVAHNPANIDSKHKNITKSRKNQTLKDRSGQAGDRTSSCASIFINRPEWLQWDHHISSKDSPEDKKQPPELDTALLVVEGKLNCPKCSFKLGSYSWYGMPCSCGTWVCPSFSIHKSRVDVEPSRPYL